MIEGWRDILGYESIYQISNHGRVGSLDRYVRGCGNSVQLKKGRVLKQFKDKAGYLVIRLCKNGKSKTYRVHILVLVAFDRIPEDNEECNHEDGNKDNNFISNIEWCTHLQNCDHRDNILNKHIKGERCHLHKLIERDVKEIRVLLKEGKLTQKQIANKYNVHRGTIYKIKIGKRWKHIKI